MPDGGEPAAEEAELAERVGARLGEYTGHLDAREFRKAAAALRALWAEGNVYLERREPWKTVKVDRDRTACTLRSALGVVLVHAVASEPFIPATARRLRDVFPGVADVPLWLDPGLGDAVAEVLRPGSVIVAPPLLFRKIDDEELRGWERRFGGETPPESPDATG